MRRISPRSNSNVNYNTSLIVRNPQAVTRSSERKISVIGTLSNTAVGTINLSYTPSANLQAAWDRYTVDKIIVRLIKDSGGYCGVIAYDPVSPTSVTTPQQVIAYSNSSIMMPSFAHTEGTIYAMISHMNYEINQPTHSSGDANGNLRTPLTTNVAWAAGSVYLASLYPTLVAQGYTWSVEYYVTFIAPRAEA